MLLFLYVKVNLLQLATKALRQNTVKTTNISNFEYFVYIIFNSIYSKVLSSNLITVLSTCWFLNSTILNLVPHISKFELQKLQMKPVHFVWCLILQQTSEAEVQKTCLTIIPPSQQKYSKIYQS